MRKIQLEIIGLQPSMTQTHNYAVVLGETNGKRRLPIIIGAFEAQAIAVAMERMSPNRPLTHDLFKSALDAFSIDMKEIIISNLVDGIFHATLVCESNGEKYNIDSRTSDALALAVRFECPIYTYETILDTAGVVLENEDDEPQDEVKQARASNTARGGRASDSSNALSHLSVAELEKKLQEVLDSEDYERAAAIRDELNKRRS